VKRVVITGLGVLSPIGNNTKETWFSLLNGTNGADKITKFDPIHCQTKIACELKNFQAQDFLDKKDCNKLDLVSQYGLIVANEALADSAILDSAIDKKRIGVIWGTGNGGASTYDQALFDYANSDQKRFSPYFVPKVLLDTTSGIISIKHGLKGVNYTTVAACASGSTAIVDAFNYIRWGKADAIIAGASDAPICESLIGGFNALKALSTNDENPHLASRPFDEKRDGFVMGEGGAALVLETLENAQKRGAKIYAEVVGGGINADAYHMTAGHPEGEGAISCMNLALEEAGISFNAIEYLNAHATSTPVGDLAESNAISKMIQDGKSPWIGATKSMTGHLMGAAGAIEGVFCALAIKNQIIPPTINLENIDQKINAGLKIVGDKAIETEINYTLSNNFGFGGHNSSLILKKIIH
jgi:3-oxoacyl-[acyl-carrier-protein] synthase II